MYNLCHETPVSHLLGDKTVGSAIHMRPIECAKEKEEESLPRKANYSLHQKNEICP